jgi:heptaprenyl diphosphate synthase
MQTVVGDVGRSAGDVAGTTGVDAGVGFLELVVRELGRELASAGKLGEIAGPMVLARTSKRARARIVWHLGGDAPVERLVHAAVAVELVHAASLLHDDVIDGALERRGIPTAHVRWGPQLAVLAGDLCLTIAMRRVGELGAEAVTRGVAVVDEMTRGVAEELLGRKDLTLDLSRWRGLAEAKTGALFGFGAWLALSMRGRAAAAKAADKALRHLGVAFQAADDASDFDLRGGETPLQDLRDGVPNHAVLAACARSPDLREALESGWRGESGAANWPELAAAIIATGALDDTRALIEEERRLGRQLLLDAVPATAAPRLREVLAWAEALTATAPRAVSMRPEA